MEQGTRAWGHRWRNSSTVRLLGVPLKLALVKARAPPKSRATLRMKGLSGTRMPGQGVAWQSAMRRAHTAMQARRWGGAPMRSTPGLSESLSVAGSRSNTRVTGPARHSEDV